MLVTETFIKWLNKQGREKERLVLQRLQLVMTGQLGFHRRFRKVLEIKWRKGQLGSTRVYCYDRHDFVAISGGGKSSQQRQQQEIKVAERLIEGIENGKIRTKVYGEIL